MKLRFYLFTSFLLLKSTIFFAQTVTISEEINIREGDSYEIIGKFDERVYLALDRSDQTEILVFDEKMNLKNTQAMEFEKKYHTVLGVVPNTEDFSIIYRYKKKLETFIKIRKYNPKLKMVDSSTVKIHKQWELSPDYDFILSRDKKTFILYHFPKHDELEALAFDTKKMKVLWNKKIALGDLSANRDLFQTVISNRGELFLVFLKDNFRLSRKKSRFIVLQVNGMEENFHAIPLKEQLIFDAFFDYDDINKQLVGGGLFDDKKIERAKGYFYLSIPSNNVNNYNLVFHNFDKEFVAAVKGKVSGEKETFNEALVNNITFRKDGGIILTVERHKVFTNSRNLNDSYSPRISPYAGYTDYYYDDLVVLSIHPDGNLHWSEILYKRQFSQNDGAIYSSYFILKNKSNLRYLYNDDIKKENSVSEYIITSEGKQERKNIMNTEQKKIQLRFKDALQVASDQVIVPSERRRFLQLVKITY